MHLDTSDVLNQVAYPLISEGLPILTEVGILVLMMPFVTGSRITAGKTLLLAQSRTAKSGSTGTWLAFLRATLPIRLSTGDISR